MTDSPRRPPTAGPRNEALAWFVRMNSGDATAADKMRFGAWLAADPVHRREYEKLGNLWSELDVLPDPRRARGAPTYHGYSRRRLLAAGAAFVGVAAAVPLSGVTTTLAADFRTGTGERKSVTASDGTRIDLDAGTAITEDYTAALRRLRLIEGRAAFSVADEPRRRLEVACGEGACHAAHGTFVVHRRVEDVVVAVEDGGVSVTTRTAGPVELRPGQCVSYSSTGLGPVETVSGDAETAWRRGKLIFRDRPLDDVVADLNRYREGRIVIADRSLAMLRLDGIFDTARPDAALEAMINTLPVRAWRLTDYLIVLWRA